MALKVVNFLTLYKKDLAVFKMTYEFESPAQIELSTLTKVGSPLGSGLPAVVTLT
jgi:hypothetical protein